MRGRDDFDDLASYRRFIDEIVSRKNARQAKRIEAERPALQRLPGQRTCDHEETLVTVTSSGGFTLQEGVLHGAVAAHRPSPAGPALR